jgi:hypothetical protein
MAMSRDPVNLDQAISRALRANLEGVQRQSEELHQAIADLVAACSSSRPANALPHLLRAQANAASLAATLDVLSRFITSASQGGRQAEESAVSLPPTQTPSGPSVPGPNVPTPMDQVSSSSSPAAFVPPPATGVAPWEVSPEASAEPIASESPEGSEQRSEFEPGTPARVPIPFHQPTEPIYAPTPEALGAEEPGQLAESQSSGLPEAPAPPADSFATSLVMPEMTVSEPPNPEPAYDGSRQAIEEQAMSERGVHGAPEPALSASFRSAATSPLAPASLDASAVIDIHGLSAELQEMHRRANRVAKVSMQDIGLLRPNHVREGREHKDICVRLQSEIEKARREYERRFQPILGHGVDYFYHWMVEVLGGGDPEALGEYPYHSPVLRH